MTSLGSIRPSCYPPITFTACQCHPLWPFWAIPRRRVECCSFFKNGWQDGQAWYLTRWHACIGVPSTEYHALECRIEEEMASESRQPKMEWVFVEFDCFPCLRRTQQYTAIRGIVLLHNTFYRTAVSPLLGRWQKEKFVTPPCIVQDVRS